LQQAILSTPSLARTLHQTSSSRLEVAFSPTAIRLSAGAARATVGVATFGRSAGTRAIGHPVPSKGGGATYVAMGASEQ
jgi:hypothetical protein